MGMLVVRHKVKDYAKWRPFFDKDIAKQQAAGLTHPRVLRSADDKNELVVMFDYMDTRKAKAFASSAEMKETMMKAGVADQPTIYFLESV
jgi:hypothetical protein